MTKKTALDAKSFLLKSKVKRAQVHAKSKSSKNPRSKNYKKQSVGQG